MAHAPFQALAVNHTGCDYFVGDIHGEFEKLRIELNMKGFRPDKDRLISVGDLVDRGRRSAQAEEWLQLPYFYAVRGNHEELYLQWRNLGGQREQQKIFEQDIYFPNGGDWVKKVNELDHLQLEKALERLPYMIVVPSKDGSLVAAVHAQLPDGSSWPQLINQPFDGKMIEEMTWSRNRMHHHTGHKSATPVWDEGIIPGLEAVVCGHYVVNRPTWVGHFCYIETAGWRPGGRFSILSLSQIVKTQKQLSI